MNKMLDLYKAVAERETGFWIDMSIATGQVVSMSRDVLLVSLIGRTWNKVTGIAKNA
jgi:hypothetical protein